MCLSLILVLLHLYQPNVFLAIPSRTLYNSLMNNLDPIVDFLFETGILAKTPRSWASFLGSGKQSVAEHINRMTYIGYCLAHLSKEKMDVRRIVQMCMFHDISESRISDLNRVHQKYTTPYLLK